MKYKIIAASLIGFLLLLIILIYWSEQTNNESYMKAQFEELESHIENRNLINKDVSAVSVAWHLDHILKVIKRLHNTIQDSDPDEYERQINAKRIAVFISGTIPRGVGKAPKQVLPPENIITEDIISQLEEAKMLLQQYDSLPENAFCNHPVFGNLSKQQTKRFIEIHTNHHLKIIRDIIK